MTATARTREPTASAMYGGMALTVVAAAALLVDLATADTLTARLNAAYPADYSAAKMASERSTALTYLFGAAAAGVPLWWATLRAHRAGRSWTRPMATMVFVVATCLAVFNLAVLLPVTLGVIGLLPCLAGLVAVVGLWRRPAPAELSR